MKLEKHLRWNLCKIFKKFQVYNRYCYSAFLGHTAHMDIFPLQNGIKSLDANKMIQVTMVLITIFYKNLEINQNN